MNTQRTVGLVVLCAVLLLLPAAGHPQTGTGAIAGVVKDTTGAVLPGVTIEAASPALLEKVRIVVTDDQGLYKVVDLRPGTYTVTFSLPGFSTVRREGLELTTGFTATVNAELKVGALEETVTVSGAAPVVDTQNVSQQQTLRRETLDALPFHRRTGSYVALIPAAVATATSQDVGGLQGERNAQFAIHGQRLADLQMNQDGSDVTLYASVTYSFNPHTTEEMVVDTGGSSAESYTGGVRVNVVPKDGGNTFSGSFNLFYSNPDLQNANLTDELRRRGLVATPSVKELYDVGGALGGPIKRDKLWFVAAYRKWAASMYMPGNFYNKLHGTPVGSDPVYRVTLYEPDLSRPAYSNDIWEDRTLRLAWQVSAKDKARLFFGSQSDCNCPMEDLGSPWAAAGNAIPAPESAGDHHYNPNWMATFNWTRPATNRLLFEVGVSGQLAATNSKRRPETGEDVISITELSTNLRYGSRGGYVTPSMATMYGTNSIREQYVQRFAVSYVTGSHAFKTGFSVAEYTVRHKNHNNLKQINGGRSYTFRNQVPVEVAIYAVPWGQLNNTTRVGAYVQDQWTIRKLTLNLGVRYDTFSASIPAQRFAASYFVPARDLPAVEDSPDWTNLSPRLGVAYDLFGNGRTALKAYLNRYPIGTLGNLNTALGDPIMVQAAKATRTWTDANGNYVPDCVLGPEVPEANGECGRISDLTFGQVRAGNTRYADDALRGFNDSQPYNWQGSVSLQQELRANMSLNVGYFRTWYGNFLFTDNLAVTPAEFDPYCITAPVDSRLPSTISGSQVCGLYDVTPAKFGRVDNLVTQAVHYGNQTEVYNGVDVTLNARFGQGGQFSGGVSVGRTVTDTCFVVDSPQQTRPGFCHVSPPWSAGTQAKFLAVYPLPWEFQASAVYQNIPGIPIAASYVATNAAIRPSLGRDLAAGARGTAVIDLIPPGTLYEDRIQQVDLRFARIFRVRKVKVEGNFDIYNALNTSPILTMTPRYGPAWLKPTKILPGRLFKVGVQLNF